MMGIFFSTNAENQAHCVIWDQSLIIIIKSHLAVLNTARQSNEVIMQLTDGTHVL